jgi:hypothetical protein
MRAFLTRKYRSQPCTSSRGRRLGWLGTAPPHGDMARTGAPVKSELSAGYYGRSSRPTTIGGEVVRHGRPRRVRGQRNACLSPPHLRGSAAPMRAGTGWSTGSTPTTTRSRGYGGRRPNDREPGRCQVAFDVFSCPRAGSACFGRPVRLRPGHFEEDGGEELFM